MSVIKFDELLAMRNDLAASEPGPRFLSKPDRWFDEGPRFRCTNGHVSSMVLKSEALGRDACLACKEPTVLTFPEDVDDPGVGAE